MAGYPPQIPTWQQAFQPPANATAGPSLQLEEDYEIVHGAYSADDFSGMDLQQQQQQQQQQHQQHQHQQHSHLTPSVQGSSPYTNYNYSSPNGQYGYHSNSNQASPTFPTTQFATQATMQHAPVLGQPPYHHHSTGYSAPQGYGAQNTYTQHQQHQHQALAGSHPQMAAAAATAGRIQPHAGEISPPFDQVQAISRRQQPQIQTQIQTQAQTQTQQQQQHQQQQQQQLLQPQQQQQQGYDDGGSDGDNDMEGSAILGEDKTQQKNKQGGACARCKGLKVKCIFDGISDRCKRCTKAREECHIPGKKKRRAPPKRETLLNQIKDQAAKIDELMRKLEHANSRAAAAALVASSPTTSRSAASDALAPFLSPSMENAAPSPASSTEPSSELSSLSGAPRTEEAAPHPDVQAWIDQARDSMRVFNGIIGGGARFVGDDPEDPASEESDPDDEALSSYSYEGGSDVVAGTEPGNDQVHIDILNSDGEETTDGLSPRPPASRRGSSVDTASVHGRSREGSPSRLKKLRTKTSAGQLGAGAPSSSSPMGLFKDLGPHLKLSSVGTAGPDQPWVLNSNFFKPGTGGEDNAKQLQHVPHILARGLVSPEECEDLFKIYFDYMNLSLSLLDPYIYTAQNTCGRSAFLFTVVCAIASRYYTKKPDLYTKLMDYARLAAGTALIGGPKTVDLVHAYILLALYPVPARRWEDDRSWVYLGLAIRVAMDINLHRPPTVKPINEQHERELLNRTRAWLNCFNLDRSMGSQHGKPPIIPNSDYVAVRSASWWQSSRFNMPLFDIHTCAYNAELRVMADFRARTHNDPSHPTGLNRKLDLEKMSTEVDEELMRLENQWTAQLVQSDMSDVQNHFRFCLIQLAYSYARLSALSFGFSHAFGKGNSPQKDQSLLMRCMRAASDVVLVTVEKAGAQNQRIFLRHGPEAQSVFVSFAAAFLIKLLHPKYAHHLTIDQRIEIRNLVQRVVELLGSSDVAMDDHHGPKLYSRFLEGLLETPMAQINPGATLAPPRSGNRRRSPTSIDLSLGQTVPIEQAMPTASSIESFQSMDGAAMLFNADEASANAAALVAQQQHQQPGFASTAATLLGDQASSLGLNTSRFFSPPLAFDPELLESMQSLPVWNEHMLPGWNWISDLNSMQPELAGQVDMFPSMDMAQMHVQAAQTMLS